MDPLNNQQPVNPINQTPVSPVPPVTPAPEQVGNPVPKTEKKYLLYGVLLGLFVVAIISIAVVYVMFSPKSQEQIAETPVVTEEVASIEPTPVEVAEVGGVGDLDNLIVGLAEADGSLTKELEALEKDSDF